MMASSTLSSLTGVAAAIDGVAVLVHEDDVGPLVLGALDAVGVGEEALDGVLARVEGRPDGVFDGALGPAFDLALSGAFGGAASPAEDALRSGHIGGEQAEEKREEKGAREAPAGLRS